jgi:hypothetical protein
MYATLSRTYTLISTTLRRTFMHSEQHHLFWQYKSTQTSQAKLETGSPGTTCTSAKPQPQLIKLHQAIVHKPPYTLVALNETRLLHVRDPTLHALLLLLLTVGCQRS